MTIKQTHDIILQIIKRTRNEYVPHDHIDNALDLAQMALFVEIMGNYRAYQPGRPVPPVVSGATTRTISDLNPFRKRETFMPGDYSATDPFNVFEGTLVLPADFEFFDGNSLYAVVMSGGTKRERPIIILDHEEYAYRSDSSIVPPSPLEPIATFDGKGGTLNGVDIGSKQKLKINPETVSGYFIYFRRPNRPSYVFTTAGRVETHDVNASVDLEWNEANCYTIIKKALELLGVMVEDQFVMQEAAREELTTA